MSSGALKNQRKQNIGRAISPTSPSPSAVPGAPVIFRRMVELSTTFHEFFIIFFLACHAGIFSSIFGNYNN